MRKNKGMTLTEIVVSMTIMGIIMLPISYMIGMGYRSFSEESRRTMAAHYAREAMNSIIGDLRRNWDVTTGVNANDLIVTTQKNPGIRYRRQGGLIYREELNPDGSLLNRVSIFSGSADEPKINITNFTLASTAINTESVIDITIALRFETSDEFSLTYSFRLKNLN